MVRIEANNGKVIEVNSQEAGVRVTVLFPLDASNPQRPLNLYLSTPAAEVLENAIRVARREAERRR